MAAKKKLGQAMSQALNGRPAPERPAERRDAEDRMREALAASQQRAEGDAIGALSSSRTRKKLIEESGYDFLDARRISPNPENDYTMDAESIEGLADSIRRTKHTEPITVRETAEGGFTIVDGERRWRAHKLLGERLGEHWYMMPVRRYTAEELPDDEARLLMDLSNLAQRAMTPTERARGIARVADAFVAERAENPDAAVNIKKTVARRFGVSERSAMQELSIGRGLGDEGASLYDGGAITKDDAEAMSRLDPASQAELAGRVRSGEVAKGGVRAAARGTAADKNARAALGSLRKAVARREPVGEEILDELRSLVEALGR